MMPWLDPARLGPTPLGARTLWASRVLVLPEPVLPVGAAVPAGDADALDALHLHRRDRVLRAVAVARRLTARPATRCARRAASIRSARGAFEPAHRATGRRQTQHAAARTRRPAARQSRAVARRRRARCCAAAYRAVPRRPRGPAPAAPQAQGRGRGSDASARHASCRCLRRALRDGARGALGAVPASLPRSTLRGVLARRVPGDAGVRPARTSFVSLRARRRAVRHRRSTR